MANTPSSTSGQADRPQYFSLQNGERQPLPFSQSEYDSRLARLRALMADSNVNAMLFTSMHNIAYYTGFLYCSFGRPYGCVVTADRCTTISANIDYAQPWRRSHCDNIVYTDWQRDNYWRAVAKAAEGNNRFGVERDHFTLAAQDALTHHLNPESIEGIGEAVTKLRMIKSDDEIMLIKTGAKVADIGGEAIRQAIKVGAREIDVAMAGRNAMELAIAELCPDSELRDNWVWFQSGVNTDGAHNPVTTRKIERGDILSLNTFPMISGYYTALERTLFAGEVDDASLKIWEANVAAHELGMSHIKPGVKCSDICDHINAHFEALGLLEYRTFGYGHSFGVLSHYYGREASLEFREDIDTVLEPGMVVSMEPMLTLPEGIPGAGGYREHDILVVTERGAENITGFPYGPENNVVA